jgi:hypothetical protein
LGYIGTKFPIPKKMFHSLQESRKESKALNDFLNADDGRLEKSMRNLGVGLMSSEEVLMSKTKLKINTEAAKKFKIENHDRIVAKVRKENRILQARKRLIHLLNGTCQSKATEVLKTELYRYMALLEISPILLFRFSDGLFELIVFNSRIGSYQYGGKLFWPAVEKCKSKFIESLLQEAGSLSEEELVMFVKEMERDKNKSDEYISFKTEININIRALAWIPDILLSYHSVFGKHGWDGWKRQDLSKNSKTVRHARRMKDKTEKKRKAKLEIHAKNVVEFLNVLHANEMSIEVWICKQDTWDKMKEYVMGRIVEIISFFRIFTVDSEGGGSLFQMSGWSSCGTVCFLFQGNFFPMELAKLIWSRVIVIVDDGLGILNAVGAFRGLHSIPFYAATLDLPGLDYVCGLENLASRLLDLDLSFVKKGVQLHHRKKKSDPYPDLTAMDNQTLLYSDVRVSDWTRRRLFGFQKIYASIDPELMQEAVGTVVEVIIGNTKEAEMEGQMRADDIFMRHMEFSSDKFLDLSELQRCRDVGIINSRNFEKHTMGAKFLRDRCQEENMNEDEAFKRKKLRKKDGSKKWPSDERVREMKKRKVFYAL